MIKPVACSYEDFESSPMQTEGMETLTIDPGEVSVHALPLIEYARAEKQPLTLRILQPSLVAEEMLEGKSYPLILFVQGSGWQWQNVESNICTLGQIVKAGYVIAMVQYRGSQEAPFPAQLLDVKRAAHWMIDHAADYHADPERIILWGNSSGGHLVSLSAVTAGIPELEPLPLRDIRSRIKGVLDFYGPIHLASMQDEPSVRDHLSAESIGGLLLGGRNVTDVPELAEQASVTTYITKDRELPPFLILHGDKDRIVPFAQSVRLAEALQNSGHSVQFYKVKNADHGGAGLWNPQIMNLCLKVMEDWLKEDSSSKPD